jgi:hypothetical protein
VADLEFSDWPDPLNLAGPQSFGLKLGFRIMGRPTYLLYEASRHSGIVTPIDIENDFVCK